MTELQNKTVATRVTANADDHYAECAAEVAGSAGATKPECSARFFHPHVAGGACSEKCTDQASVDSDEAVGDPADWRSERNEGLHEIIIRTSELVKQYGDVTAVNHLNLEIHKGEVFGLLGPNGSGKTTAINCLLSLLKYDKGIIEVFGQPMAPDNYQAKQQIGIVLQNVAVFDELTVYENIDYFCGLYIIRTRSCNFRVFILIRITFKRFVFIVLYIVT